MSTSRDFPIPTAHPEGFIHPPNPTLWQMHNPTHLPSHNGTYSSTNSSAPGKKPVRDSKRRATHSQIERRRREKINDRLITLRSIVPACVAEIEERKRIKFEEVEEARKIASGELSANMIRGGKRKRNRRRAAAAAAASANKKEGEGDDKEEELGLHKLEVLTHTIDYIYQLQERIEELETGNVPQKRRVNDEDEEDAANQAEGSRIQNTVNRQSSLMEEDEEDEENSEAHLEMAEWKGIQVKPIPTKTENEIRRPSYGRSKSTITSDFTNSLNPSPITFGNFIGESPLFSTTASSSSTSNFTALTSPMMSLSAESPIMCLGMGSSSTNASPKGIKEQEENSVMENRTKLSTIASSSSSSSTKSSSRKLGGEQVWRLPSPAISTFDSRHQRSKSINPSHNLPNLSKQLPQHDDAKLLLAFSTSPEVLRPTSAERFSTVHRETNIKDHHTSTKPLRMNKIVDGRSIVLDSAPGGTRPTSHSALLPSPPFLALDKSVENSDQTSSHQSHLHSD